jgi:hypothetical protein
MRTIPEIRAEVVAQRFIRSFDSNNPSHWDTLLNVLSWSLHYPALQTQVAYLMKLLKISDVKAGD